ncbi:uncharacterized protein [Primulina eburnea]|uniref:uncharacterized protein n=1 Tax=Primulina eburnea TaxID=1245227 RepID=UPI003C6C3CA4
MIDAASGGALVNKTPQEARALISNMAANAQQFSTRQDNPLRPVNEVSVTPIDQKLDSFTSLLEKLDARQGQQETRASIQNLGTQITQIATSVSKLEAQNSGKLPSQTVVNPKENASIMVLRSGKEIDQKNTSPTRDTEEKSTNEEIEGESEKQPKVNSNSFSSTISNAVVPSFPSRLEKSKKLDYEKEVLEIFRKVEINIPLIDAIKQIPRYAKSLKDLCTNKRRFKSDEKVSLGGSVSAVIKNSLPNKCKDPGVVEDVLVQECFEETYEIDNFHMQAQLEMEGELAEAWEISETDEESQTVVPNLETEILIPHNKLLPSVLLAPKLELKDLPDHLKYIYLGDNETLSVIILKRLTKEQEERLTTILREHKTAIGWTLADIKSTSPSICMHRIRLEDDAKSVREFQRKPSPVMKEVVMKKILKLLDEGIIYPISDSKWIVIAQEDQEKTTFTCLFGRLAYRRMPFGLCNAPGIVLGHVVSSRGIEVDKAKVELITNLRYPTNVKGIRGFLGHAGFYRMFIKDFSKISLPMSKLLQKDVLFEFGEDCKEAFNNLKNMLTIAPNIQPPDWNLPFEIMCDANNYAVGTVLGQKVDKKTSKYLLTKKESKPRLRRLILLLQEFDIEIKDRKGIENPVADHLSRLVNEDNVLPVSEFFPDEQLFQVKGMNPWYADIVNYLVTGILPNDLSKSGKVKIRCETYLKLNISRS